MKKFTAVMLVGAMLLTSGCAKGKNEQAEEERPIAISVQKVTKGDVYNMQTFSGKTEAGIETAIHAELSGTVEKVCVKEGQKVNKGDLLFTIKGDNVEDGIKQAKAGVDIAKAAYENTTGGGKNAQILQLENAVTIAQLSYDEAKRNYDIYKELYEAGGVSKDQFTKIELAFKQANQQLETAKKNCETSKNETIPQSEKMAREQLSQAQVTYDIAVSNREKLAVTAPVSGVISQVAFDANEMITPNTPAVSIAGLDEMAVKLNITEKDVSIFKVGQKVDVKIGDKKIPGKVTEVSKVVDPRTSLHTIKVQIDNNDQTLIGGLTAEVILTTSASKNTIKIPKNAIIEEDDKAYVYCIVNNKAVKTPVEIGMKDVYYVTIKNGLNGGDTIAVEGLNLISDGTNVFPVEKEA